MIASWRLWVYGLGVPLLFLTASGAFLFFHLATPSDGARLEPGNQTWARDGVIVTPLQIQPNGLQRGDVVIAVDGRSLESQTQSLFDLSLWRTDGQPGRTVRYTIRRNELSLELDIPLKPFPLGAIIAKNWSTLLFTAISQITIAFAFVRKPNDPAARMLYVWAWSLSHMYVWSLGLQVSDLVSGFGVWLYHLSASGAWIIFWSALVGFGLVYPKPLAIMQQRNHLLATIFLLPQFLFAAFLVFAWLTTPTRLEWLASWAPAEAVVGFIATLAFIGLLSAGYRATHEIADRQKVRWVMFSAFLSSGFGLVFWFLPELVVGQPLIDANALGLSLLPFPFALVIAIVRYQLFDIDIIIRRTLIYSALTTALVSLYFGCVILLQQLFRAMTGQQQSEVVTVVSTLAIAALFTPLRARVQNAIDSRFYRKKYDAARIIAQFAQTARDEVELSKLSERLVQVIEETVQPARVNLWLNSHSVRGRKTMDGKL